MPLILTPAWLHETRDFSYEYCANDEVIVVEHRAGFPDHGNYMNTPDFEVFKKQMEQIGHIFEEIVPDRPLT